MSTDNDQFIEAVAILGIAVSVVSMVANLVFSLFALLLAFRLLYASSQ